MKIILSNEYRIEHIPLNYVLLKTSLSMGNANNKTDTPKLVTSTVGYYATISGAVKRYIDKAIEDGTEDFNGDIYDFLKRLEDITESAVDKKIEVVMDEIERKQKWK